MLLQTVTQKSTIRRILVRIDATHVRPVDLKPILKVARPFAAEVTLLHCYSTPASFGYAVGASVPQRCMKKQFDTIEAPAFRRPEPW
jgi:hypothetical protein